MELSGQLHAAAALPPGKEPWYPSHRRVCGLQSRSGRGGTLIKLAHFAKISLKFPPGTNSKENKRILFAEKHSFWFKMFTAINFLTSEHRDDGRAEK